MCTSGVRGLQLLPRDLQGLACATGRRPLCKRCSFGALLSGTFLPLRKSAYQKRLPAPFWLRWREVHDGAVRGIGVGSDSAEAETESRLPHQREFPMVHRSSALETQQIDA